MHNRLQSQNHYLRQKLEDLLHEARQNETKMRQLDHFQHQLIACSSLPELLQLMLSGYKRAFGVEFVTLALVDPEYEATRILEGDPGRNLASDGLTLLPSPATLEALYPLTRGPYLSTFCDATHASLFNAPPGAIASVALLPLTRHGKLIGSLHLGSAHPERFLPGYGTNLLERLADILAICLENALSHERLKQMGLTDALTGVQNRHHFEHRCQVEISLACRHKHPLACLFLDIDHFKRVNDTYGHQAGDAVLIDVARSIQSQLRIGDTIARYGGEEFVVLLPRTDLLPACQIAERIRCCIAEKELQAHSGQPIRLTLSIGLAMLPNDNSAIEPRQLGSRMIAAADQALYQAKYEGRNQVICDGSLPASPAQAVHPTWIARLQQTMTRITHAARKPFGRIWF